MTSSVVEGEAAVPLLQKAFTRISHSHLPQALQPPTLLPRVEAVGLGDVPIGVISSHKLA